MSIKVIKLDNAEDLKKILGLEETDTEENETKEDEIPEGIKQFLDIMGISSDDIHIAKEPVEKQESNEGFITDEFLDGLIDQFAEERGIEIPLFLRDILKKTYLEMRKNKDNDEVKDFIENLCDCSKCPKADRCQSKIKKDILNEIETLGTKAIDLNGQITEIDLEIALEGYSVELDKKKKKLKSEYVYTLRKISTLSNQLQ